MKNQEVKVDVPHIRLSDIIPDPNQPRKFFNEAELNDLSQSIAQHGVIEPILVRPHGKKYMIVFGERRFRASKLAQELNKQLKTIPAMVRELSDAEALELQIIENLQRSDPHPMEEAASYAKWNETIDITDLALRAGKSAKYVASRLVLNNLLPEFQEMFFRGIFDMGDAVALAKISHDNQHLILKERIPDDWKTRGTFVIHNLGSSVKRAENNLDSAPFKTEDAELYPEFGPCNACRFNSFNNLTLFTDGDTSRICSNSICFQIKKDRSFVKTVEELLTDPNSVFVHGYLYDKADISAVEEVKKMGGSVYGDGKWERVDADQQPIWETYFKDNDQYYDIDDYENEEERIKFIRESFEDEVAEWKRSQEYTQRAREEGRVVRAYVLRGNDAGKFIEVIITAPTERYKAKDADAGSEIERIEAKEARNKELDAEKIWSKLTDHMIKGEGSTLFNSDRPLVGVELKAVCMALYESISHSYEFHKGVLKLKDYPNNISVAKLFEKASDKQLEKYYHRLCRELIRTKLFNFNYSHLHSGDRHFGKLVTELYDPSFVEQVTNEQSEIAEKRGIRVKQRIAALKTADTSQKKKGRSNKTKNDTEG